MRDLLRRLSEAVVNFLVGGREGGDGGGNTARMGLEKTDGTKGLVGSLVKVGRFRVQSVQTRNSRQNALHGKRQK